MRWPHPLGRLVGRISVVALLVALVAVSIITIGVLIVAHSTFDQLMVGAGHSKSTADAMFERSVATIFGFAAIAAGVVSVPLALVIATRMARPLNEMDRAARRIA